MLTQPDTWRPIQSVVTFDGIHDAAGITDEASSWVRALATEYDRHAPHNRMLRDYYDGHVAVGDYGVTSRRAMARPPATTPSV